MERDQILDAIGRDNVTIHFQDKELPPGKLEVIVIHDVGEKYVFYVSKHEEAPVRGIRSRGVGMMELSRITQMEWEVTSKVSVSA
jgi:hypothetical protein